MQGNAFRVAATLLSFSVVSAEIDNFRALTQDLKDSQTIVDLYMAEGLRAAVDKANLATASCSESALYSALTDEFHNHFLGDTYNRIAQSSEIDFFKIETQKSIYGGMTFGEGPILSTVLSSIGVAQVLGVAMGSVLNYDGHYIGTDKLEHFWGTGWGYFKRAYRGRSKPDIEAALKWGEGTEKGILGAFMTGVYSYGDLAANFDGMRFWNHVLQKHDDVLGPAQNLGPYISCENKKWSIVKYPNLKDYVKKSWNEAYNCSKFSEQSLLDRIKQSLSQISSSKGCPFEAYDQEELRSFYANYSKRLLNDSFKVLPEFQAPRMLSRDMRHPHQRSVGMRIPKESLKPVPGEILRMVEFPEGTQLFYKVPHLYRARLFIGTGRGTYKPLKVENVRLKKGLGRIDMYCWNVFISGGTECSETPDSPQDKDFVDGELDLLSYGRRVSAEQGMLKAREALFDRIRVESLDGGRLENLVVRSTKDKNFSVENSLLDLKHEDRKNLGVIVVYGIDVDGDSPNRALIRNAAQSLDMMGFPTYLMKQTRPEPTKKMLPKWLLKSLRSSINMSLLFSLQLLRVWQILCIFFLITLLNGSLLKGKNLN